MAVVALITIGVMALILFAILGYLGLFQKIKVQVRRPPFADCIFLYKFFRGRYSNSAPAFHEVSKFSSKFCCVGIYFDDPEKVPFLLIKLSILDDYFYYLHQLAPCPAQ